MLWPVIRFLVIRFLLQSMAVLPTPGGDTNTWGTGLNAFLAVAHDTTTGELLDAKIGKSTINAQIASYTIVNSDAGRIVRMTNAAAITMTIPTDAVISGGAIAIGTAITVVQGGAGQVTIAPAAGVTLNSRGALTRLAGQYAYATLIKVAANSWELTGDLA